LSRRLLLKYGGIEKETNLREDAPAVPADAEAVTMELIDQFL
jgi:hypothetical protein